MDNKDSVLCIVFRPNMPVMFDWASKDNFLSSCIMHSMVAFG